VKGKKMVTLADYTEATDLYQGFCTTCEDFTREQTEPDACNYDCPICENETVYGAEEALMMGFFDLLA